MKLKPVLFFVHRWLGIGMCLLFALWFASGIVMMYVEYPELTEEERLANLLPIEFDAIRIVPSQVSAIAERSGNFAGLKLTTISVKISSWLLPCSIAYSQGILENLDQNVRRYRWNLT